MIMITCLLRKNPYFPVQACVQQSCPLCKWKDQTDNPLNAVKLKNKRNCHIAGLK